MRYADMHIDTLNKLLRARAAGTDCSKQNLYKNDFQVDIERLSRANYAAQFFASFVNIGKPPITDSYLMDAIQMMDIFYADIQGHSDKIRYAGSYEDYIKNKEMGLVSGMLSTEGGGVLEGNLDNVERLYDKGMRMFGIIWNHENELGYPNCNPEDSQRGLKTLGKELLERLDDRGVIIDVSHLSDGGFWDVVNLGKRPFMASHSNARAICEHSRNLDDEMIRALADRGGIMGLNIFGLFLEKHKLGEDGKAIALQSKFDAMIRHISHIINKGGEDVIVLGTDFDGIPEQDADIEDCSQMPKLAEALKNKGFKHSLIEKIAYKNFEGFLKNYF